MSVKENATDPLTGKDRRSITWEAFYLAPEFLLIPLGAEEHWPKWEHFRDLQSPQLMVAPSVELYLFLKTQRPATFPRYRPYSYTTICDVISNYLVSRREKFIRGTDVETYHIGRDPLGSLLSREIVKRSQLTRIIRNHLLILGTSVDTSNWVLEPKLGHHGEELGLNIAQHPFLQQPVKSRPTKRPFDSSPNEPLEVHHPGIQLGAVQGALSAIKPSTTPKPLMVNTVSAPPSSRPKEIDDNREIVLTTAKLLDLIKKEDNRKRLSLMTLLQELLQEKKEKVESDDKKLSETKVVSLNSQGVQCASVNSLDTHGKKFSRTLTPSIESELTSYNQFNPTEPSDWPSISSELFKKYKNHNLT